MSAPAKSNPLHNREQMAALIAEVSGEEVGRAAELLDAELRRPGGTVADDFARCGGKRYEWGPALEAFYGQTRAFLYELAIWNRNLLKHRLRRWTSKHLLARGRGLDLLSIGDGLGFDCLQFARDGQRVTYFELPGLCERFARRLFERSGVDVPILTDPASIPEASFDAITCFDVLEHVPDPPAMVRSFASYLRPGGTLYVSAPFFMLAKWYPTHLKSNRRFSGSLALYRQAGLRLIDGTPAWYPIVLQKPGADGKTSGRLPARLAVGATGAVQRVGRFAAWPFYFAHLLRRVYNRPLPTTGPAAAPGPVDRG